MSVTLTRLSYHFIWSTKDRMELITSDRQPRLYSYMGTIIGDMNGTPIKINGTKNHTHLLAELHQSTSPSEVVKHLKANSSRWMNDQFPALSKFQWQQGYAAFTVSKSNVPDVKDYIRHQENTIDIQPSEKNIRNSWNVTALMCRTKTSFEEVQ